VILRRHSQQRIDLLFQSHVTCAMAADEVPAIRLLKTQGLFEQPEDQAAIDGGSH